MPMVKKLTFLVFLFICFVIYSVFTFDYDSINDQCITVRNRDTLVQERINIDRIFNYLIDMVKN